MEKSRPVLGAWFVAVLGVLALAGSPSVVRAQTQDLDGLGPGSIVRIIVGHGAVNVHTWDRPSVGVDEPGALTIRRFGVEANPAQSTVPILAGHVSGPEGDVDLPAESFAVSSLAPGRHDVVTLHAQSANLNVNVPQNAALVTVQMGKGNVSISDYKQGTFVARVRNGSAHLQNVGGDGYVQVMRGPITADASSFNRLRTRSGTGDIVFENCRAKQIEVSSVHGSIVYDGGSFQPGLARFETQTGNVALGVNGGAQLAAHASPGRVFTSFGSSARVSGREGEQQATTAGGGPVVNASSGTGSVYLYDGSLASKRLPVEWQPVRSAMVRTGHTVPALSAPSTAAQPASRTLNEPVHAASQSHAATHRNAASHPKHVAQPPRTKPRAEAPVYKPRAETPVYKPRAIERPPVTNRQAPQRERPMGLPPPPSERPGRDRPIHERSGGKHGIPPG